jgi:branched-chain amino acid transport system permease protein
MLGSIYALVALGWTLIYKCSGVLNLAMGELTLIGAYICITLYRWFTPMMPLTTAFVLAILCTLIMGVILGLLTEHLVLRPMIGESVLSVIMITVGLSFFFKGMIFTFFGADTRVFDPPVFRLKPIMFGNIAGASSPPSYCWWSSSAFSNTPGGGSPCRLVPMMKWPASPSG